MICLYCTTDLPVDSNGDTITCPKCGSAFDVIKTGHRFMLSDVYVDLLEQVEKDIAKLGIGPEGR